MCIANPQEGDRLIWLWDSCVFATSIKHLLMTHHISFLRGRVGGTLLWIKPTA